MRCNVSCCQRTVKKSIGWGVTPALCDQLDYAVTLSLLYQTSISERLKGTHDGNKELDLLIDLRRRYAVQEADGISLQSELLVQTYHFPTPLPIPYLYLKLIFELQTCLDIHA